MQLILNNILHWMGPMMNSSAQLTGEAIRPELGLWLCTLYVERNHGSEAQLFVSRRIDGLRSAGDSVGVAAWEAVGRRLLQLRVRAVMH